MLLQLISFIYFRMANDYTDLQGCHPIFSNSTPTLATVIPAIDHIDETRTSQSLDSDYEPAIRTALGLPRKS